ncbi:MAG: uridine kinase [Chitinophagales bacterium]|nr:uridine kinase [Bacteroidota bacterium]
MLIIGIAGGTGSGKTTVVKKILHQLPNDMVAIVSQDNYYRNHEELSFEERCQLNYDHPDALEFSLLIKHLKLLKQGKSIDMPVYSYVQHARLEETISVKAKKVIIVEGLMVLWEATLRKLLDIKVFVDADDDERLIRRIRRDMLQRGRSVEDILKQYEATVKPMHLQFIEPSKRYADIIIPQGGNNAVGIELLATRIKMKLMEN